jgi:hypothetical protein
MYVLRFSYYRVSAPWETHWFAIANGVTLVALDQSGEEVGFTLVGNKGEKEGEWNERILYQLEVKPGRDCPIFIAKGIYDATSRQEIYGNQFAAFKTTCIANVDGSGF